MSSSHQSGDSILEAETVASYQAEVPLLDETVLRQLMADTSLDDLRRFVTLFARDLDAQVPAIGAAVSALDLDGLGREAHTLKSTAATFGALRLAECARRVDGCCKASDASGAYDAAGFISELADDTSRAMRIFIAEAEGG